MANSIASKAGSVSVILGLALAASAAFVPARPLSIVTPRTSAPPLSLKDASGKSIRLSDYKGRVVLLDFWATWCTGCKLEIPWFIEFEKKYRSQGLAAVGVAVDDEGWQTIKPYLVQHPISYPVVLGNMDVLQRTFGLPASLPVTLLVDRRGRIASTHAGVVDKNMFEKDIQHLLAESSK